MRARLRDESGVAVVVALMIAGLMLGLAVALLAYVDAQSNQSGTERVKESSLTLAEGALNAEVNLISNSWPSTASTAFAPCTQASTGNSCADATALLGGFTNHDFGTGGSAATWSVTVRDNGTGNFYDDAVTASQPAFDSNGDNLVWLRAQASVRGQTRTLVALVRAFPLARDFPRGVVTAGKFKTSNSGKKVIVDSGSGPGITVRCTPGAGAPLPTDGCLGYVATKGQVWPNSYTSTPTQPAAMSSSDISAMRTKAQAAGTYFANCPSNLPSGSIVFIENGPCSYTGTNTYNSAASPGMLLVNSGTLHFGGSVTFYGLLYCPNASNLSTDVVLLDGNAQVVGAVAVDGNGGVSAGSSKTNIVYDPNAFNVVATNATVSVIANTWRELNGP